jgi:hypothetical protein
VTRKICFTNLTGWVGGAAGLPKIMNKTDMLTLFHLAITTNGKDKSGRRHTYMCTSEEDATIIQTLHKIASSL